MCFFAIAIYNEFLFFACAIYNEFLFFAIAKNKNQDKTLICTCQAL